MKLVVMRHGQTDYNREQRYTGTIDAPINATGRAQAIAAGTVPGISLVYTSPLRRAQETARLCFPQAELRVYPGLREMNFGDFQGACAAELDGDEYFCRWQASKWALCAPHGESRDDHRRLVLDTIRDIIEQAERTGTDPIVIVAHGGVIMAICDGLLRPAEKGSRDYQSWNPGNCGLICADINHDDDGALSLSHLTMHRTVSFIEALL